MDTANPQGGGRRVRTAPSKRLQQEEEEVARLIAAGFKPVDRGDRLVWVNRDGVCYGRQAALQEVVKRKQREEDA